jgi:micrococcal nuclease
LGAREVMRAKKKTVVAGKVISIADGDTLTVLTANKQQIKVRLSGIDTPERKQAFGTKAKQALSSKVHGRTVRVKDNGKDRYKRTLGDVFLGERWINLELVKEGYAWHYKAYSKDKRLAQAEVEARSAKRGLWVDGKPVPPWEFRRGGK